MSREELQIYLEAQLDEIRRYHHEQMAQGRPQLELRNAILEWTERFAATFHDNWRAHPQNRAA